MHATVRVARRHASVPTAWQREGLHLLCLAQAPVEQPLGIGADVCGRVAARDDRDAPLDVPAQQHLAPPARCNQRQPGTVRRARCSLLRATQDMRPPITRAEVQTWRPRTCEPATTRRRADAVPLHMKASCPLGAQPAAAPAAPASRRACRRRAVERAGCWGRARLRGRPSDLLRHAQHLRQRQQPARALPQRRVGHAVQALRARAPVRPPAALAPSQPGLAPRLGQCPASHARTDTAATRFAAAMLASCGPTKSGPTCDTAARQ